MELVPCHLMVSEASQDLHLRPLIQEVEPLKVTEILQGDLLLWDRSHILPLGEVRSFLIFHLVLALAWNWVMMHHRSYWEGPQIEDQAEVDRTVLRASVEERCKEAVLVQEWKRWEVDHYDQETEVELDWISCC